MVGTARFELTTSRTPSERATRLRYVPKYRILRVNLRQVFVKLNGEGCDVRLRGSDRFSASHAIRAIARLRILMIRGAQGLMIHVHAFRLFPPARSGQIRQPLNRQTTSDFQPAAGNYVLFHHPSPLLAQDEQFSGGWFHGSQLAAFSWLPRW